MSLKCLAKKRLQSVLTKSLASSAKEQGLVDMTEKLKKIVPDITDQYTQFKVDTPYLEANVRNMHAFQISLISRIVDEFEKLTIVDIGDSSGTHLQYILGLYSKDKDIKCLSGNLDKEAVDKIKKKGLEATHARAEDLHEYNIYADVFLCFEMLEHLMNPCAFLHDLSTKTNAKYLIVTIPYLNRSRVGLHHLRKKNNRKVYAENTHIFELSPEDWKLLIKHSGWNVEYEQIYLQYPKRNLYLLTKPLWKRKDFEGFYGLILKRDQTYSSRYADW